MSINLAQSPACLIGGQSTKRVTDIPLLVLPTAAGKSVICAEVVRQMWEQWPLFHPRTVVLVPSKELAEQNAEKLKALLPPTIKVGFVSASLNKNSMTQM